MKEQILNVLNDRYEALDTIEINDLLGLATPEDLSRLNNALDALVKENLLYKTKCSKDCDLRTYRGFMKFTQSSFCINPISYSPRNPKYSDKSFIAITNGIQYGIFDRETGQLIESNYDKSKDIPD